MTILQLNTANFDSTLAEHDKPVVVDFYADWCGPCKALAPMLEEFAAEQNEVAVAKVDIEKSPELAAKFGVRSIPTLVLMKNGSEANRLVGGPPKSMLREFASG